jgi:opacity protein-like surface antigen
MKTKNPFYSIIAACVLTLMQTSTILAQQDRFYMKADAGVVAAKDVALNVFLGVGIPTNAKISFDPGVRLGFRAGYGFTDWFAGEIETGITANNIDDITGASEANGTFAKIPLMLNGRINLPNKYRVSPYIGAGAGVASTVLTANDIAYTPGAGMNGSVADVVFVWQAFAGFRIALGEKTALNIGYHYLNAAPSDMRVDDGFVPDRIRLGRSESHAVTVAFEWSF